MAKGKYTRKEAGIKAYSEVTGEELPPRVTVAEIREYSKALPRISASAATNCTFTT